MTGETTISNDTPQTGQTTAINRRGSHALAELVCYLAAVVVIAGLGMLDERTSMGFVSKSLMMTLGVGLVAAGLLAHPHRRIIAQREWLSYFYSPIGYVVSCLFMFIAGLFFVLFVFAEGQPASLRPLFTALVWAIVAICPGISMRLLAEELRGGTIEPLMTSPVTDVNVVIGKWAGAVGFLVVLYLPTLAFVALLAWRAEPDYGPIYTGYLGLLLVGALYLAIGALASALTRNQIIAFIATVVILLVVTVVTYYLPQYIGDATWAQIVLYINVNEQYQDFAKGLIDTSNFVYFFTTTGLFLLMATKALESRKWR